MGRIGITAICEIGGENYLGNDTGCPQVDFSILLLVWDVYTMGTVYVKTDLILF